VNSEDPILAQMKQDTDQIIRTLIEVAPPTPGDVADLDQLKKSAADLVDTLIEGTLEHLGSSPKCAEANCIGGPMMIMALVTEMNLKRTFMAAFFTAIYRLAEQKRETTSGQ
jgi:hypothetical protein